jgi:hypothetical protein
MKMFKVLIVALIAASVAWAQMPEVNKPAVPCEHRGSFFSVGLGLSYMSLSKDEYVSHRSEDGDWDNPSHRYVVKSVKYWGPKRHWEFSGAEAPSLDLRFGGTIGNVVALYFTFMGGLYRGTAVREENNIEQYYLPDANGTLIFQSENSKSYYRREFDAIAAYGWFGVGFSVYPFRDPSSPLRGLYFGFSGGLDALGVRVEDNYDDVATESYFLRYEVGKDWWVSETWSIGVALSFTNVVGFEDDYYGSDGGGRKAVTLLFRITRG